MTEYQDFNRVESFRRGIDPAVTEAAWNTEGGLTEPAKVGKFATGWSFWAPQLHYGGRGYEHFGTVAGMGNSFTAKTGWQPGDPKAWRDALRYALDAVKAGGWGPWYGPQAIGIVGMRGVDVNYPWSGTPDDEWDYKTGAGYVPKVKYDPNTPAIPQDDDWSCAPTSLRWALKALGRNPGPNYIEDLLVRDGIVTREQGLLDASGAQLAAWIGRTGPEYYGGDGFYGNSEPSVTFDGLAREGDHAYPLMAGGRGWNHWTGVRGYDPIRDLLLLANPAEGWGGVYQTMSREQFSALGPFSMVRVLHPDLLEQPAPTPSRAAVLIGEIRTRLDELERLAS